MAFFRKIRSFIAIPGATKWLLAEALATSLYVKITLAFLPFRKVANWLGTAQSSSPQVAIEADVLPLVKNIQSAIKLCDKYASWPTECYTRALTGKIMLRRRKIPSTIYIGFYRNEQNKMLGHAWLQCSEMIITGGGEHLKYQVHSFFT